MSEERRGKPACLSPGDPRVRAFLGVQAPPAQGERIVRSRYVRVLYEKGRYLLFHTLTRQMLVMMPGDIDRLGDGRAFPASVLSQALPAELYANWFLVPEHTPESKLCTDLRSVLLLRETLPRVITHYVILPTTVCNANCFYCFERGMPRRTMSGATAEDTLCFILAHRAPDRPVHIHWFGGEPLCAADLIDRISEGLKAAGADFNAGMTSNGSLFTEDTIRRAAASWRVGRVQITLDGLAEEYERRKRYAGAPGDPFGTVIRAMHRLIAAGIRVTVRLNADEDNAGELFRTADFLFDAFSAQEREKLRVYAHALYGRAGECPDGCPGGAVPEASEERASEINDYLRRLGLLPLDFGELFSFRTRYCMASPPGNSVLVDASGKLYACEAMTEAMRCGDVKTGFDPEARTRIASPCSVRGECEACAYLPQCTEFDRCPNRAPFDACRRREERELDRRLRIAYGIWREQRNGPEQGPGTEEREANGVSD